jgi:hypothetical protein
MHRKFLLFIVLVLASFNWMMSAYAQATRLQGTVASATGQPIAGASVIIGSYSVVTDPSGHFVLDNLRAGQYSVTIIPIGKRPRTFPVAVSATPTNHDFKVDW